MQPRGFLKFLIILAFCRFSDAGNIEKQQTIKNERAKKVMSKMRTSSRKARKVLDSLPDHHYESKKQAFLQGNNASLANASTTLLELSSEVKELCPENTKYHGTKRGCVSCEPGFANLAGDDTTGPTTQCDDNLITSEFKRENVHQSQAESSTYPGPRQGACTWVDRVDGTLWMFGGAVHEGKYPEVPSSNRWLNELWKYTIGTGIWEFVGGDRSVTNSNGTFPAWGQSSTDAWPGARERCMAAALINGTAFVYGGNGIDEVGRLPTMTQPLLGDMWLFDPRPAQSGHYWTWVGGRKGIFGSGNYGTKGVETSFNSPGARQGGDLFVDADEQIWLVGGYGFGRYRKDARLADVWKYDPSSNLWTWISGEDAVVYYGQWGLRGVTNASTAISSRFDANAWMGSDSRTLYMHAGFGDYEEWHMNLKGTGMLGDIWKFDTTTLQWTWIGGPCHPKQLGHSVVFHGESSRCNYMGPIRGGAVFKTSGTGDNVVTIFGQGKNSNHQGGSNLGMSNAAWHLKVESEGVPQAFVGGDLNGDKDVVPRSNDFTPGREYPQARAHASFWDVGGGIMFTFGGTNQTDVLNDMWRFSFNGSIPDSTSTCNLTVGQMERWETVLPYPSELPAKPFPAFHDDQDFHNTSNGTVYEEVLIGGVSKFELRNSGSCPVAIATFEECEDAAEYLNLTDTDAALDTGAQSVHPRYCYYDTVKDELFFNTDALDFPNAGPCTTDLPCLCDVGEQFPIISFEIEDETQGTSWNLETDGQTLFYESLERKQGETSAGKAKEFAIQNGVLEYNINIRTPTEQKLEAGPWVFICYAHQANFLDGHGKYAGTYWFQIEKSNNNAPSGSTYSFPYYHAVTTRYNKAKVESGREDLWSWDSWVSSPQFDKWESISLSLPTGLNTIRIAPSKAGVRLDKCALYLDGLERRDGVVDRRPDSRFAAVVAHLGGNPTHYPIDGWYTPDLADSKLSFEGSENTVFEVYGGPKCSPILKFDFADKVPDNKYWQSAEAKNGNLTALQSILPAGGGAIEFPFYVSSAINGVDRWHLICLSRQDPEGHPFDGQTFSFRVKGTERPWSSHDYSWWTEYEVEQDWSWMNHKSWQREGSSLMTIPHGSNYFSIRPTTDFKISNGVEVPGAIVDKCVLYGRDPSLPRDTRIVQSGPGSEVQGVIDAIESGDTYNALQDCVSERDKNMAFPEGMCDESYTVRCDEVPVDGGVTEDQCDQCPALEKYCCKCTGTHTACPQLFFDPAYVPPSNLRVVHFPSVNYTEACGSTLLRLEFLALCSTGFSPLTCTECKAGDGDIYVKFEGETQDLEDLIEDLPSQISPSVLTLTSVGYDVNLVGGEDATYTPPSLPFGLPRPSVPSSLGLVEIPSGVVRNDPHFTGFDGSRYDFHGIIGKVFNIISDQNVQINAKFIKSNWDDKTFMGKIGVDLFRHRILIDPTSVRLDRKEVKAGQSRHLFRGGLLQVELSNRNNLLITTIKAVGFNFVIQTHLRKDGLLYLNFETVAHHFKDPHGVLGQTARYLVKGTLPHPVEVDRRNLNAVGFLEGDVEDYIVHDGIHGHTFKFNRFRHLRSYKSWEEEAAEATWKRSSPADEISDTLVKAAVLAELEDKVTGEVGSN